MKIIKQLRFRTKLLLFLALVLVPLFYIQPKTFAQTTDPTTKYNISFPVAQLGGCNNLGECRTFCEDPVNAAACVNFAKAKGFYQEDAVITKKDEVLSKAKTQFGCGSFAECKAFCEISDNFDKCESFARTNSIVGGRVIPPSASNIVEKAKESLGCDSAGTCASFCSNPENQSKCSEFAKNVGIKGGEQKRGPGGCTSDETCRLFCSDPVNYNQCSRFSGNQGGFRGPGGCSSEESCKNYCSQNPSGCRMVSVDPYSGAGIIDNPQKAAEEYKKYCENSPQRCGSNTNFFSDKDARVEFEKFCAANPTNCGAKTFVNQTEQQRRSEYEDYCKKSPTGCTSIGGYVDPNDYCKKSPDRCPNQSRVDQRFEVVNFDPARACSATPNCRWDQNSCQCGTQPNNRPQGGSQSCTPPTSGCGINSYWDYGQCGCKAAYNSTSYSSGNTLSRDEQERVCKGGGGSCDWSSGICNCQGYKAPTPGAYNGGPGAYNSTAQEACQRAGWSWTGTNCVSPSSGGSPGGPSASYPGKSSSGGGAYGGGYDASGKYVGGSYGGYDSAGKYVGTGSAEQGCKSAGGTWNGTSCTMPNSGSSSSSTSAPSGMSRESQESGCRSCGGTCNWNGDNCGCRCASSSSSGGSSSSPAPTSAPAASTPAPSSGGSTPAPTSSPSVQGVSTSRSLLQMVLDIFR